MVLKQLFCNAFLNIIIYLFLKADLKREQDMYEKTVEESQIIWIKGLQLYTERDNSS